MPTFAAAAFGAVIISAAVMLLVFSRLKLMNTMTLVSITFASLITIAVFPLVFGLIARLKGGAADLSTLMFVSALTIVFFLIIAFLLSILISTIIPKLHRSPVKAGTELSETENSTTINQVSPTENENYLEQIYDKLIHENDGETLNNAEDTDKAENNLEKSVDSSENIDKMGIENIVQNSAVMTIEDCIEEAFRLKESDDAEGAVQYFIDALDKKPQKELTFWIVLDICVLYKNLGQAELAYDILNSYHDTFGEMMDASVKEEIEYSLFEIQA